MAPSPTDLGRTKETRGDRPLGSGRSPFQAVCGVLSVSLRRGRSPCHQPEAARAPNPETAKVARETKAHADPARDFGSKVLSRTRQIQFHECQIICRDYAGFVEIHRWLKARETHSRGTWRQQASREAVLTDGGER